MSDERRPSGPGPSSGHSRGPGGNRPRGNRPGGNRPPAPLTGPLVVDAATNDALLLFNARLAAQAENEKAERRVQKAARAKDDAAAKVRALENDTKASAEARAEAAAAYRGALEAWERAKRGETDPAPATTDAEPAEDADGADGAEPTDAVDGADEGADTGAADAADSADGAPPADPTDTTAD